MKHHRHPLPDLLANVSVQAGTLPNINIVQIRNGEPSIVNQQYGFDEDDVSVRASGLTWMIEKFQHLVRFSHPSPSLCLILATSSQTLIFP